METTHDLERNPLGDSWPGIVAGLVALPPPKEVKPPRQARKLSPPKTEKPPVTPDWPRADAEALKHFNPATKQCVMNCGQAKGDPRTWQECRFLCDDCWPAVPDRVVPYERRAVRKGETTFTVRNEDADEAERRLKG